MTAEICVMNRNGIALATDSAVTIGSGQKVYNTANKLFALSKYEPVGVMIYGNAHHIKVPWETVIKLYRQKLAIEAKSYTKDYLHDFLAFLTNNTYNELTSIEADNDNASRLIYTFANDFFKLALRTAKHFVNKDRTMPKTEEEIFEEILKLVLKEEERLSSLDLLVGFDEPDVNEFKRRHEGTLNSVLDYNFSSLFSYDYVNVKNRLKELIVSKIFKEFSSGKTGLVIAGFGVNELYPSAHSVEIDGIISGKLKYRFTNDMSITNHEPAIIEPFAQSDVVNSFLNGIDPLIHKFTFLELNGLFNSLPRKIAELLEELTHPEVSIDQLEKAFAKLFNKVYNDYNTAYDDYKRKQFTEPALQVVASLPKDELSEIAESLINITSFRRRVSSGPETVGGPVDVAVITKGDGFVWINRKHYFQKELNAQFHANYFRRDQDVQRTT